MSTKLLHLVEKQKITIQLLENELKSTNQALAEKSEFAAALEVDLENVINQLMNSTKYENSYQSY